MLFSICKQEATRPRKDTMPYPFEISYLRAYQYGLLAAHEDVLAAQASGKSEVADHTFQAAQLRELQRAALEREQHAESRTQ